MVTIVPILGLLIDYYIYKMMKRSDCPHWSIILHQVLTVVFFLDLFISSLFPKSVTDNKVIVVLMWTLYAYFCVYGPKLLFVICDWIGTKIKPNNPSKFPLTRLIGIIVAITTFCIMMWAAFVNRFNYQVREVTIDIPGLPEAFDGYRIVQISDMHVGSYDNDTTFVARVVDKINSIPKDVVYFTGDIVNRTSHELPPFVPVLSRLTAPDGVYSIMGNHDYADYMDFESAEDQCLDIEWLGYYEKEMGWKLLHNQTDTIVKDNDTLMLIGLGNIGDKPLKVYGDLEKAYPNIGDHHKKILLSHPPTHWEDSISNRPGYNIDLTLSGHTHAMQMEAWGISPAWFRYHKWMGRYHDKQNQQLYVNIGMGTVGMPMRIGATPEITVITLRSVPEGTKIAK